MRILFILLFVFINSNIAIAYEVNTHENMNESISTYSTMFSINEYLVENLNITLAIDSMLRGKQIRKWLAYGGKKEDDPYWSLGPLNPNLRFVNHFHNPLEEDPARAGLWGDGLFGRWLADSAMLWAQAAVGAQPHGGHYSWHDARNYYLTALTAPLKGMRDQGFADTFRAVGQVMHLVQDMGVPEHARDDGHFFKAYEAWLVDPNTQRPGLFLST